MTTQLSNPSAPAPDTDAPAEPGSDRRTHHHPHVGRPVVLAVAAALIAATAVVAFVVARGDGPGNRVVAGDAAPDAAPAPSVAPTTLAPADPAIRSVDFANFTYPATACPAFDAGPAEGYPVRNGEYRRAEEGTGPLALWRTDHPVAYGDVNGDGIEDAAVVIGCAWASGTQYGWIFAGNPAAPAQPQPLALITLDEATLAGAGLSDVLLEDVAIEEGVVKAAYAGFLPTDARCCPSRVLRTEQRWTGTAWAFATPPVAATAA